MAVLYVSCAAIGGTILLLQFLMTVIGLGGDALDLDLPDDVDADLDISPNTDFSGDGADDHLNSSWLFGVISFRTLVAAAAFFGVAGLGGQSAGLHPFQTLLLATASGIAAMYGVYWVMEMLKSLQSDGTAHVGLAVGSHGSVYVTIPAEERGQGKIQLNLRERTVELAAVTDGDALAPGKRVVVTEIVDTETVKVAPLDEV